MDSINDALDNGLRSSALSIVDDFTHECPVFAVDRSLPNAHVVREPERIARVRGCLEVVVCDNGPEFRGNALDRWAHEYRVSL